MNKFLKKYLPEFQIIFKGYCDTELKVREATKTEVEKFNTEVKERGEFYIFEAGEKRNRLDMLVCFDKKDLLEEQKILTVLDGVIKMIHDKAAIEFFKK